MESFGFARFINTTWKTVIKFLDKVNWNVSPDVLQHFPQLLQVYGSSLHFLFLHVCPHLLNDVHVRTLAGQFRTVKLPSCFLFSRDFLITLFLVLGVVIVLENEVLSNKSLSDGNSVVDEYHLLVFECCKVIGDLVQMPDFAVGDRAPDL